MQFHLEQKHLTEFICDFVVQKVVYAPLPYIIFLVMSLLAAGLATQLPETLQQSLPGTLSDAANIEENRSVATRRWTFTFTQISV